LPGLSGRLLSGLRLGGLGNTRADDYGRDDGCIGAELLEGMEKLFPKGLKKEVVPGAGHFVHQEKPELVNEVVLKFLKG
jgi:pimeloyl-ACP methyl ester carboxylesterase